MLSETTAEGAQRFVAPSREPSQNEPELEPQPVDNFAPPLDRVALGTLLVQHFSK
ncbi:hypothetical protein TRAPUB_9039 [Trametes pubescens]|uniref:Uncharacterized protein n=1 Tax=Trametes pubescens TaxID=154538 RepID=A0A1M2W3G7_TRAPU|nr:hypothetical protein TRAPUB_9039 [Trametes pubescens]